MLSERFPAKFHCNMAPDSEVAGSILESLSTHYEYDSDYGWRPIKPCVHAPLVIPLSLLDSSTIEIRSIVL